MWPPLEDFVKSCVLIVEARTAVVSGDHREFTVSEVWVGTLDLLPVNQAGRYVSRQGEHGIAVEEGQEIVFFFNRTNQARDGTLIRHNSAFPIRDGRLVYASTSDDYYCEYTVDEFKKRVLAIRGE